MQHTNSNEATNEAASIESPFRVKGQTCRLCKFQNKAESDRLKKNTSRKIKQCCVLMDFLSQDSLPSMERQFFSRL